jgi:hypothetical protein
VLGWIQAKAATDGGFRVGYGCWSPMPGVLGRSPGCWRRQRQAQLEPGATIWRAGQVQLAAVGVGQPPGDV